MTDDHVLGWYLACTCDVLLLVCSLVGFQHACSLLIGIQLLHLGLGLDDQIVCRCVIGYLFVHDCLLHDCSFPCMTAYCLCLGACVYPLISESLVLVDYSSQIAYVTWESFPIVRLQPSQGFGIGFSIRVISMFGSTMEKMDIQTMKICIALSWISWMHMWLACHFDC